VTSRQPPLTLTLSIEDAGSHDLGRWWITEVDSRYEREHGNYYIATLTRRD
jgi:hypothetical protein